MPRYRFVPPRPDYPAASVAHFASAALSRRVTEAELRLDGEVVRLSIDPAQRTDGWQLSDPLPEPVPPSDPARFRPSGSDGALPSSTPIANQAQEAHRRPSEVTHDPGQGEWM